LFCSALSLAFRRTCTGPSGLGNEVLFVARQRLKGARNPIAFSESETERRSRFGSISVSDGFLERTPLVGSERTVSAVAEPEPTEWSPVMGVGTGDRGAERRTAPSVGASFERTSGSRREVKCVVLRRSSRRSRGRCSLVLAATVARARGDPRARRDEKAKPACREE